MKRERSIKQREQLDGYVKARANAERICGKCATWQGDEDWHLAYCHVARQRTRHTSTCRHWRRRL